MTDQDDLKTALSLMDKHWAGDQNAKDLIRACCANQCLPHPLQYCADGAIRPVTRVPVIDGLDLDTARQAALDALDEADECFQPETMEALRDHFVTIRYALQSPRVPVIDTALVAMLETAIENPNSFSHDALVGIIHRAYAALQKGD